ncbi:MAG: alkaline phosphatase family protein [Polyangiaceae bacterium]|nr:alkaline phosphatase family protein [Polyangiaceae bacterium]
MRARYVTVGLLVLAAGCVGVSATDVKAPASQPRRPEGARLVVVAVFDQLGTATLERLMPSLDADGAIRSVAARGSFHRVAYPYAATYTAPGHATLHTGVAPSQSGILANERWHPERGEISWLDDPASPVIGDAASSASPRALRTDTVGDALKAATGGRAKVVSVSVKDRAAIVPGGRRPDVAVWYSSTTRGFTTARHYAEAIPSCAARHAASRAAESLLDPWLPDPKTPTPRADAAPGEGHYLGWSSAFPHDPRLSTAPWVVLKLTPALTIDSLALAQRCADELDLGQDSVPDLLALSLSATDYTGHVFGPESREYADALIRTDRALGRLLESLAARTRLAVLISSDHGVTALPEASGLGGRLIPKNVVAELEAALDRSLGTGDWVAGFVAPFVSLTPSARLRRAEAMPALLQALSGLEGVHAAFDARLGEQLRKSTRKLERAVGLSLTADPPGDAFVVPLEGWSVDPDMAIGAGTSHGSPWRADAEVPALFAGPGVYRAASRETLDARRVAPTIAALLDTPAPRLATLPPLPGAPMPRIAAK